MKKPTFISIIILIILLITITLEGINYKIITTSFTDDGTEILYYNNDKLVNKEHFTINQVEDTFNNGEVLIDSYSGELIDVNNISKKFNTYINPVDYINLNNSIYILHNEGINAFSIKEYSDNYELNLSTEVFKGYPRNFILYENLFYVLANEYDDESNRTVKLYIIDPNKLNYIDEIIIKDQTFGFYADEKEGNIDIYGNKSEVTKHLALSTYNLKEKKLYDFIEFNTKAIWVDKVLEIENKKYIVNSLSVIVLDNKNEITQTLKVKNKNIIDCGYYEKKEKFIILAGNYETEEYEVLTCDKNLKLLKQIKLEIDSRRPINIIVDN